jgi:hypothetical protein
MTKLKTFAAVALAATTLTMVAATDSAFARGGGFGGGRGFGGYNHGFSYNHGFGGFRHGSYYGYGYGYPSFSYYSDCSWNWNHRWGCGY